MAKSISIPITGNAAPLRRTLQNTQKDVGKFGSSVGAAFTKLGKVAAIGAGAAVAGAVALGKAAFDAAETASHTFQHSVNSQNGSTSQTQKQHAWSSSSKLFHHLTFMATLSF